MKTALQCLVMLLLLTAAGGAGFAAAEDEIGAAAERSIAFEYGKTIFTESFRPDSNEDVICSIGDPAPWIDYSLTLLDDREMVSEIVGSGEKVNESQSRRAWFKVQEKLTDYIIRNESISILDDDDALWAWGIDGNGYFSVLILPGKKVSKARMAEVYKIIESQAVEMGLYDEIGMTPAEMPIPLYFEYLPFPTAEPALEPAKHRRYHPDEADDGITIPEVPEDAVAWNPATDRTALFRPVVGGCKVSVETTDGQVASGTVCCAAATEFSGKKGYIISKHLVRNAQYSLKNNKIFQPHPDISNAKAGTLGYVAGWHADAAFVTYSDVKAAVLDNNNQKQSITSSRDPVCNEAVQLSGMVSSITTGEISMQISQIQNPTLKGDKTLLRQWQATYQCANGDSGAPVLAGQHCLVGIHWGHDNIGHSYLSPTSGFEGDLGVYVLTSY